MLVYEPAVQWAIDEVGLRSDDFYFRERHGLIFEEIQRLVAEDKAIDSLIVTDSLKSSGHLEGVGGAHFVASLAEKVNAPGNAKSHAEIIRSHSHTRQAIKHSSEIAGAAAKGDIATARNLASAFPDLELCADNAPALLDLEALQGLEPPEYLVDGHLVARSSNVLYGQPGAGKSFLALDWALCVATGTDWIAR
ncbi:MAG: AAA family ATPase [Solirubrobacterales bacterium]|nr:AAA family ATPase [Solirubrobacterales bacterium]